MLSQSRAGLRAGRLLPTQAGFSSGPSQHARPFSVISTRRSQPNPPFRGPPSGEVDSKKPSFNALLFESMAMRVKKDRDEKQRFADLREAAEAKRRGGDPSYRIGGLITVLTLAGVALGYRLGSSSNYNPAKDASTLQLQHAPPIQHNTDIHTLQALWGQIGEIIGKENVSTAEFDLASHATSDWSTHKPSTPAGDRPFLVARPETTAEVSAIMRACHARRVPVTAYSGGTSLEGQFAATRGGVSIDFSRMDKIVALNKDDLDVVVQPGVGWEGLNDTLSSDGLFFPPDPGPGALIGGMIGTGCSGTNAYHYGTMREWVLGMTVVLADGTVIKTRQRPRKSSTGYDLTKLIIGSEGTLGLVTEATLKLTPLPAASSVAVCSFPSIGQAAQCVSRVVEKGIPVAAVELLDDEQMKCINHMNATTRKWPEATTLFFKFAGPSASALKEQASAVQAVAKAEGMVNRSFQFARDEAEAQELWAARKDSLWSVMNMPSPDTSSNTAGAAPNAPTQHRMWTTDVAVPISRLPEIITETKDELRRHNILGSIVGHVGDGNFHAIIRYRPNEQVTESVVHGIDPDTGLPQYAQATRSEEQVVADIVHRMVRRAIEMEGTASGEHGVGLGKREFLVEELGQDAVDAMRRIKSALDPHCLLNCDKVVKMSAEDSE